MPSFPTRPLGLLVAALLLAACGPRVLSTPELVERAIPFTVAIEVERDVAPARSSGSAEPSAATAPARDYGAGVVLDDGAILTSAHLVEGAARLLVRPPDADTPPLPARVVGVSLCDDLAVLQVEAAGLRPARLGASAELRLGVAVAALGHAPGAGPRSPTVSEGIVTRLGLAPGGLPPESLFMTSAPLLPGGTGGPLLSRAGEVVGIMTAGRFAVPAGGADYVIGIDYARRVAAQLREGGSVLSLGLELVEPGQVSVAGADPAALAAFGPDAGAGGLFVRSVAPDAGAAGVEPGDLLVAAAGRPVRSLADLCGALGGQGLRLPAELELLRRSGADVERVVGALLGPSGAPTAAQRDLPRPTAIDLGAGTPIAPAAPAAPTAAAPPAQALAPTATAQPAPAVALPELSPAELQAARDALAAERAQQRELFFETFDSQATKRRWRPTDEPAGARELVYSYYRLSLRQPGAVLADAWGERPLGPRYIVEVEVALPPTGASAVGLTYDQQTDGSGLSTFTLGADGSWQAATFQDGAPVPGRFVRGVSPAFVAGGGVNYLRVVRLPEGAQLWLNDTLVARVAPGPFGGGHVGVIAIAGPEAATQPVAVIVDNFRLLEHQ